MKGYLVWKHHWDDADDEKIFLDLDKAKKFVEEQNAKLSKTRDDYGNLVWEAYSYDDEGIEIIE